MYEVKDWAEVHRLFDREGLSKMRIGERLGMSRNTVSRFLDLAEPPRYEREPTGSKLDAYKGAIVKMLDVDEEAPSRPTVAAPSTLTAGYGVRTIALLEDSFVA